MSRGAACFATAARLRQSGWLQETDEVVVFNTGTGILYSHTAKVDAPLLSTGVPLPAG
jgi:threonine synthase